jgi:glycosyltransferase involved in cell wall biosynthesis
MKLLLVTQYFWPEGFSINEVARTLVERGIELRVLTGKPNYPEGRIYPGYRPLAVEREDHDGARIDRVPIVPRGLRSPMLLALNYLSFIVSATLLGPWCLRGFHPDAILVYCPSPLLQALPALLIGWLKRAPVAVYVQDLWPESLEATGYVRSRWLLKAVAAVVAFIYRRADLILISSRPFEAPIRRLAPNARIVYQPNSVDAALADPETAERLPLPVLDSGFSVMFAGNIGAAQAMPVIVEAAALLLPRPDIKLVIVGSGSELEWLERQRSERGLTNLHLVGRFPPAAMPSLFSRASALLVTLADRPIFAMTVPNKTQAYMAAGRPIIACMNGEGARLVVEAQAGLAVAAEDPRGLADAVLRLYGMSAEERERLGANGRRYYREHFEHEKLVSDLVGHLKGAVASKP